jgi:hypothetical protein
MTADGAEASSDAQPRMIGPPPNPDHDLERPAASPDPGGPYIGQSRAARRIVPAEPEPNFTSTPALPAFSRTFVEVSEDDREVAARPKRQS